MANLEFKVGDRVTHVDEQHGFGVVTYTLRDGATVCWDSWTGGHDGDSHCNRKNNHWYCQNDRLRHVDAPKATPPYSAGQRVRLVRSRYSFDKVGDVVTIKRPLFNGDEAQMVDHPKHPDEVGWYYKNTDLEPLDDAVPQTIKVGDRVKIVGYDNSGKKKQCMFASPHAIGQCGVVKNINVDMVFGQHVIVIADDGTKHTCMPPEALRLVDTTKEQCRDSVPEPNYKEIFNEVTTTKEPTTMSNSLDNPIRTLREKLDDDTVILRRVGLENIDGTPTTDAKQAMFEELWQEKRGDYADKLREARRLEIAAENGETTTPVSTDPSEQ